MKNLRGGSPVRRIVCGREHMGCRGSISAGGSGVSTVMRHEEEVHDRQLLALACRLTLPSSSACHEQLTFSSYPHTTRLVHTTLSSVRSSGCICLEALYLPRLCSLAARRPRRSTSMTLTSKSPLRRRRLRSTPERPFQQSSRCETRVSPLTCVLSMVPCSPQRRVLTPRIYYRYRSGHQEAQQARPVPELRPSPQMGSGEGSMLVGRAAWDTHEEARAWLSTRVSAHRR